MMKISGRLSILALVLSTTAALAEPARFESPEAAFTAVMDALKARDRAEVLRIFGPEYEDILSTGNADEDREI